MPIAGVEKSRRRRRDEARSYGLPSQNERKRIEANRAAKQKLWDEIAARA
jgi:hypothetical protein